MTNPTTRPPGSPPVGWREWAIRRLPFGHRRQREMSGTGLRAVTTYPTISRQDKVSDFYFNCLCGTGHLLEGVQRPHVSDGQRRW